MKVLLPILALQMGWGAPPQEEVKLPSREQWLQMEIDKLLVQHTKLVGAWVEYNDALDNWAELVLQERTILDVRDRHIGIAKAKNNVVQKAKRVRELFEALVKRAKAVEKATGNLPES